MDRNVFKKNWYELATELKERWPDLTNSDLQYISGDESRLVEVVMKRRHVSQKDAEDDVRFFINSLPQRQKFA